MSYTQNICCVINSLGPGGMERVMSTLINNFADYNNENIHLIIYGRMHEIFYDINENVIIHKPKFKFSQKHKIFSTFRTILYLRNEIKKISPICVLSFGEEWNNFVLLATLGLRCSVFVSDRASPNCNMSNIQKFLRQKLYPRASGVIFQTHKAYEIFKDIYTNKNTCIIGNPIKQIINEQQICRENIIVSVGRLAAGKHFDRLIKLFNDLNKKDWKLIIIGGNTQNSNIHNNLEQLLISLGNPANIILAGTQKNVNEYLLKSKIFAFTSSSEGFPNVIGEALSAGLPVISYDCIAGPSDLIHDGENGYLIPLFDDELFKKKLLLLMDNENLVAKMSENAKKSILDFDEKAISKKYYNFITNTK